MSSPEVRVRVRVQVRVGGAESSNPLIMWLVTSPDHLESPDEHKFRFGWKGLAVNNKDHPIIFATQKIPRALEALYQEPRPHTYVFLISQYHDWRQAPILYFPALIILGPHHLVVFKNSPSSVIPWFVKSPWALLPNECSWNSHPYEFLNLSIVDNSWWQCFISFGYTT